MHYLTRYIRGLLSLLCRLDVRLGREVVVKKR